MKKIYTIYLDFDGTCVEFAYPKIGMCNFGCVEIMDRLQKAGHRIILNTYRIECNNDTLQHSLKWFTTASSYVKDRSLDIDLKITEYTPKKLDAPSWNWKTFEDNGVIYIDDQSFGIPLKDGQQIKNSKMVDWDELDRQFQEHNLY